jgi:serine/threonine protein kinase
MADRIGQRLGNYTLVRLLGQGGFAEVYLGEHFYLKSQAAIKILQTRLSGSDDTDSFLTEAQTIARLSHPNIVRVMDFGIDGETPYLVMDYAPNGTLRSTHPRGTPLPMTTIIPYVRQISDALQYAHDEHIIHRDIKPENMLLGKRNEFLLSDFGIALVAQSSRYQGTQDVIGTVAYMSPEQIQGKPRPASDQYSLAVVVYEWLTGDRPFHGSFTEMCTQHMFAPPPPIRERLPQISPAIEQALMKALDKDPKQRFETIKGFADALEQAGQSYQTTVIPPMAVNPSYNTVFMPTGTGQPSQAPGLPGASPLPAQPYTMLQSQPYGSATNDPRGTGLGSNPNQTGQNTTGQNTTGNMGPPTTGPTAHSAPTVAQTGFDPRNPQPPQPAPGGQFGPQKMILPGQPGRPNQSGPNSPQQRPPVGAPNNFPQAGAPPYNPNMQRPPSQFPPQQNPGYNNAPRPPYQGQGPNNFQQNSGQGFGGPASYPGSGQQNRPNQNPQQRQAPSGYDDEDDYPSSPRRREASRQPAAHEPYESHESMASWLGPLSTYKLQIISTFVGIVLFCAFHDFRPEIYGRHIPVVLVLPLFFGGAFGLLPGIIVGVVGDMFAGLLYASSDPITTTLFQNHLFSSYHTWWFPMAFYGIAGLATGLSMLGPRKFPSIGTAIRSIILAIIALAIVIGFVLYSTREFHLFLTISLIVLANIAISLILLIVYSIVGRLINIG